MSCWLAGLREQLLLISPCGKLLPSNRSIYSGVNFESLSAQPVEATTIAVTTNTTTTTLSNTTTPQSPLITPAYPLHRAVAYWDLAGVKAALGQVSVRVGVCGAQLIASKPSLNRALSHMH